MDNGIRNIGPKTLKHMEKVIDNKKKSALIDLNKIIKHMEQNHG